jgi:hypothetical protein
MDHTVEYQDGGATVEVNLGPLCLSHPGLKSAGGWWLHQRLPGRFAWRRPLGSTYRTRGEPMAPPLPEPVPGGPERTTATPSTRRPSDRPRRALVTFSRPVTTAQ